jgi:hypothetical protein
VYACQQPSLADRLNLAVYRMVICWILWEESNWRCEEIPDMFKVRMDADFAAPYGDPMSGRMVYLRQGYRPGIMVNMFGMERAKSK